MLRPESNNGHDAEAPDEVAAREAFRSGHEREIVWVQLTRVRGQVPLSPSLWKNLFSRTLFFRLLTIYHVDTCSGVFRGSASDI
jgi:hypothetical protein